LESPQGTSGRGADRSLRARGPARTVPRPPRSGAPMNRMRTLLPAAVAAVLLTPLATAQVDATAAKQAYAAGEAAWQEQDWEAAAAAYGTVVEHAPKDGRAWHRLGYALHALGRLDE